jgi:hypothetical protein
MTAASPLPMLFSLKHGAFIQANWPLFTGAWPVFIPVLTIVI